MIDTVPGTAEAVENVVPSASNLSAANDATEVAQESGTGDLAGPDGAAVADIAATVQPLMDTGQSVS